MLMLANSYVAIANKGLHETECSYMHVFIYSYYACMPAQGIAIYILRLQAKLITSNTLAVATASNFISYYLFQIRK